MNNNIKYNTRQLFVFVLFAMLLLGSSKAIAQTDQINVTGTVTLEEDSSSLPGATILIKGTSQGVTTDFDGNYSIQVSDSNAILVFSFVGFTTQEVAVNGQTVINVDLAQSAEALDEVVVTALGIQRDQKSLGYSVEVVEAEELTRVVHDNVLNSMSGKVSGVTINSTGGTGSSVSMVIRGATSLSTDNQPLFVVDGVPIANTINNVRSVGSDNAVDYGNAISDLDPESIESVTILKGPSAAALYGTRAGNGVVLITTKKAKAGQGMQISITSNTVFDIPSKFLRQDNSRSTGIFPFRPEDVGTNNLVPTVDPANAIFSGSENDKGYFAVQWHSPLDANGVPIPIELVSYSDNVKNFFNDYAYTTTNGVSLSSSTDVVNYRLGFTNLTHSGLIPNSDLHKNNITLGASSKLWDQLTISTDVNFSNSWAGNRPATANRGTNPVEWAYNHPSNIDIRDLADYGTYPNIVRVSSGHENPYFMANEINNSFDRFRLYGNIVANWEINESFDLMGRITMNKFDETFETKIAPGYLREPNNGTYGITVNNGLERNMDFLFTYKHDWSDFSLSASVGANYLYQKGSSLHNSAKTGSGLVVPNVFTVQNISSGALVYRNSRFEKVIYSAYAMVNLDWNDMLYLDLTARNDWSSTLPSDNRSYFYPSASLSFLIDQAVDLGKVDMLKARAGWAQVGNDTGPYRLESVYSDAGQWGDATRLAVPSGLLAPNLLPENATSLEFGIDFIMFKNRLRFEGTYYTLDNENQILGVPLAASSGFSSVQINAGLLQSKGYELIIGGTPVRTENWSWDLSVNYTTNETTIIELAEGINQINFWEESKVRSIGYVKGYTATEFDGPEDGLVGNLYARRVLRVKDENSPYFGYPHLPDDGLDTELTGDDEYTKIGNYNPDFIMGLQSALSFKNFTLNMTFDWRKGGQYKSGTWRRITDGIANEVWLEQMVNPGDLGGAASQELRDWVVENEDQLLLAADGDLRPVGGPTPEYGGFPEGFSGTTVYDASFAPGVLGHYDDDGKFVLERENLGDEGTVFIPYAGSYPWSIGAVDVFDADYIKLRELALTYTLPDKISRAAKMSNVFFSIYTRNIMLWTKDSELGVDPERAFQSDGSGFKQGVEQWNAQPWVTPIGFKIGLTF